MHWPFNKRSKLYISFGWLWLGLCALTAEGLGSIPDQGTKVSQVMQQGQKKKKKKERKKKNIYILKKICNSFKKSESLTMVKIHPPHMLRKS